MKDKTNLKKDIVIINPYIDNLPIGYSNIGLASIDSVLNHNNIQHDMVNISWRNIPDIDKYISHSDIFGISVMDHTYALARRLIKRLQDKTIILGGCTASAIPDYILKKNPGVDYVILNEGEERLVKLLKSFREPELFDSIDGIAYRNKNNEIIIRPPEKFVPMDDLPIPGNLVISNDVVFVELARGCYGRCRYCKEISKMRFKSAINVAREIQHWYTKGYKVVYLGGANSIANGPLLLDLVNELEKRKLPIELCPVGRPEDILRNHDVLTSLFQSQIIRVIAIEIGIEANSQRMLDLLGRGTTPELNDKAMTSLQELRAEYSPDTRILANMILFSHFDMTIEDFIANVEFIGKYQCSRDVLSLKLCGYAKTPIWDDMLAKGFKSDELLALQIREYPFTDTTVNQLVNKLVHEPQQHLQQAIQFPGTFFRLQQKIHDTLIDFYNSGDIRKAVMDFL